MCSIRRIAQVFVEQIERDPGQILTLKCACDLFSQFLKQKNMPVLARSEVKLMLGGIDTGAVWFGAAK